jgi:Cd2+/Zn2+-exporting ATPase
MDCSSEESEIRRSLEPVPGIISLHFHLQSRTLTIQAADSAYERAIAAIRQAGFLPEPIDTPAGVDAQSRTTSGEAHAQEFGAGVPRLAASLGIALAAEFLDFLAPPGWAWEAGGMALAVAAIWLAGLDVYKKGFSALLRGKLNINALMSVAVTGAFLIGEWPEAAMVMALYAIAELIEARAVDRARNAIQGLLALAPEEALTRDEAGTWRLLPVGDVPVDALVRIKPGERVPLDGIITQGGGAVNQAPVTGESIPVDKGPGDPVYAGTINENGELEFRVTAVAGNSTLARIIHAVERAQGMRAPTQRFVDRFAAVYTPAVFLIAVTVALAMPLVTDIGWLGALYKALVLLVIACPCALVISTPVTVVSGLAAAARRGILLKGGVYLESARNLKAVAMDKTGTVTEGKPRLVEWAAWGGAEHGSVRSLAASLASRSDHPVSRAIAAGLDGESLPVTAFHALPGRGVQATVSGRNLLLGNHRAVHERGLCGPELENSLRLQEEQGRTVTLLADETDVLGWFAVADTVKESSRRAVMELQALGVTPVMLTGDNVATANVIAAQVGIREVRGDLLPEAKLDAIKAMQARWGTTAMAGDGINDAPALAQADIGFAMGGAGTDTAMEAADVVIMNDDLQRLPETIRLSRRTHTVLWQNIGLALGIKAVFLVLAVFGSATMWMAVFADMGASLLVVANGLRVLRR